MNLDECWNVDFTYDDELDEKDYIVLPVNFFYSKIVMFDYENDKILLMKMLLGLNSIIVGVITLVILIKKNILIVSFVFLY